MKTKKVSAGSRVMKATFQDRVGKAIQGAQTVAAEIAAKGGISALSKADYASAKRRMHRALRGLG